MASNFSTTFADKLRNAQDLMANVRGFEGYAPPRMQERPEGMQSLFDNIITVNANETDMLQAYRFAVKMRQIAFYGVQGSVEKLFPLIRGYVNSQYGKKSNEAIFLNSIIKKMRSTKINRTVTEPADPENEKALTKSEKSYGAMTKYFGDIVATLAKYPGYEPSNPVLQLPVLQAQATNLTDLNDSVAEKISSLMLIKADRLGLYYELSDRIQRIKSYVLSHYGIESKEFNMINSAKV